MDIKKFNPDIPFSKFAYLENYIFSEVRNNFHSRCYLIPEEFFCIVIWKSNRAKGKIKNLLLRSGSLEAVIKNITKQIHDEKDNKKKLKNLIEKWKFRLPMASSILTVLYPKDFSIYDYRVIEQIGMNDFKDRKNQIERYFSEFLPKVQECGLGESLRDKDKYLWGKSFYNSLLKFLNDR